MENGEESDRSDERSDNKKINRRNLLRTTGIAAAGSMGLVGTSERASAGAIGSCTDYLDAPSDFPFIEGSTTNGDFPTGDPAELVIYVHGWLEINGSGEDQAYTLEEALRQNGYSHPVVSFTYDSANLWWWEAKDQAEDGGRNLAAWIQDYQSDHSSTDIRIVGHSLGARASLTALNELAADGDSVKSLDLVGGAVDDDEVATDGDWSDGIANGAEHVNNYWSESDEVLDQIYELGEFDDAVGNVGAEGSTASNYTDFDVSDSVATHCDYQKPDVGIVPSMVSNWDGDGSAEGCVNGKCVGDRFYVTADALNVRDAPYGDDIGTVYYGDEGEAVDGPVYEDGYYWWEIDWKTIDEPTGWSAGDWLQRVDDESSQCYNNKCVGDGVTVTADSGLNVREGPGTGYDVITAEDHGATGEIVQDHVHNDGYVWWKIEYDDGVTGWSAGNWLQTGKIDTS